MVEALERFNKPEKVEEAVLANKYAPVPEMVNWVAEALLKVVGPATFKVVDLRFEIVEEELLERRLPLMLASPETYKEVVVALPDDIWRLEMVEEELLEIRYPEISKLVVEACLKVKAPIFEMVSPLPLMVEEETLKRFPV